MENQDRASPLALIRLTWCDEFFMNELFLNALCHCSFPTMRFSDQQSPENIFLNPGLISLVGKGQEG